MCRINCFLGSEEVWRHGSHPCAGADAAALLPGVAATSQCKLCPLQGQTPTGETEGGGSFETHDTR